MEVVSGEGKLALSWLDVVVIALVLFCGLGAWSTAQRNQAIFLGDDEAPTEADYHERHGIPKLQADLRRAEAELAATESRFLERQLDLTTAEAARPATDAPRLPPSKGEAKPSSEQSTDLAVTRRIVEALAARRSALQKEVAALSTLLAKARRAATREVGRDSRSFHRRQNAVTVVVAFTLTAISLFVVWIVVSLAGAVTGLRPQWRLVFLIALPALLLIVAYQAGDWLGAAVVGLALFIAVGFLRRDRVPPAQAGS